MIVIDFVYFRYIFRYNFFYMYLIYKNIFTSHIPRYVNQSSSYFPLYYPQPKAEGYCFVHERPSFYLSIRSHYLVAAEWNFTKLIQNMYDYNDVMHVKFGQAGFNSS